MPVNNPTLNVQYHHINKLPNKNKKFSQQITNKITKYLENNKIISPKIRKFQAYKTPKNSSPITKKNYIFFSPIKKEIIQT